MSDPSLRARTTRLFYSSVCDAFCRMVPHDSGDGRACRLVRRRGWLVLRGLKPRIVHRLVDQSGLGPIWMLLARQLQSQASPPGFRFPMSVAVRFPMSVAMIYCLAGSCQPGCHPNRPVRPTLLVSSASISSP